MTNSREASGHLVNFFSSKSLLDFFLHHHPRQRQEKEQDILRLEKELELAKEQRRDLADRITREEASAARTKAAEKAARAAEESARFEEEMARQEAQKVELEQEIRRLRAGQAAIEQAERAKADEAKENAARKRGEDAEKQRLSLLSECRRLETARDERRRRLAAQHLNSEQLVTRRLGTAAPPTIEDTQGYLSFADSIGKQQHRLLKQSGWGDKDVRRTEGAELTRRQSNASARVGGDHQDRGVPESQMRDLEQIDRRQKWHIDSDLVLNGAAGGGAGITNSTTPTPRLSDADELLNSRPSRDWVSRAFDTVNVPVVPSPLPQYFTPERVRGGGLKVVASPIPYVNTGSAGLVSSVGGSPEGGGGGGVGDTSPAPPLRPLIQPLPSLGYGGVQQTAPLFVPASRSSLTDSQTSVRNSFALGMGDDVDHIVNEVYLPNHAATSRG